MENRREGIAPGQRVVFSVTASCGECPMCRRGLTAKCVQVRKTGHEAVEEVPGRIPDAVASTAGCAVATVIAALEQAGDLCGRSVLVTGVGMLGMIAVVAARAGGCQADLADVVSGPGGGHLVDVSLEFSGAASAVGECLASLDIGGRAVLAGTVAPVGDVQVDPEWLVRGWRTVTGVHNYEPRHLEEGVAFLDSEGDQLPWDQLLDGPVPLDRLPEVFATASPAARVVIITGG